ncbi:MAG: hypothetical protein ABSE69_12805 [Roseiarcus sp.]|jgi:hypothetical protein
MTSDERGGEETRNHFSGFLDRTDAAAARFSPQVNFSPAAHGCHCVKER